MFTYQATHASTVDGSTAMQVGLLGPDQRVLMNEDGHLWSDPADRWKPIPVTPPVERKYAAEHVFLLGIVVGTWEGSRDDAQDYLLRTLPRPNEQPSGEYIDSWWVAEDDRRDGSDNSSATFIPGDFGQGLPQGIATRILEDYDNITVSLSGMSGAAALSIIMRAAKAFLHSTDDPDIDLGDLADALFVDRADVEALS